uniref:AAA+ ATPase domain-containing protein n=1 Tax=Culex tarsalis TaxID=7177 RepID=A0A1Q3F432_CULTA
MAAVRNIVNQSSFPAPFILFGPPGTGKTSTIAEAIGQIYHQRPKANVLVAATSNFAANELTNRLLGVVPEEAVFRFFSKSCTRKVDEFDNEVLEVSNLNGKIYQRLCYEDVYQSRVVVCTLATAGRLNQARIAANHFSYVFIDECGSAKEISALIPIAGIATFGNEITASVVLAGDPRQLGPVIMYDYLSHSSQSRSMLDRLIDHPLYRIDPGTGEYNRQVIIQLRDNFRSHAAILQYSNKTFYKARLRAKACPEVSGWAIGWSQLPNQNFPIIFHPTIGKSLQDKSSTSLYNEVEADQVMWYIRKILSEGINGREFKQCDIGVISPYALQVAHLKNRFREPKWADIEIGSVEQYQGREKPIIIVSTVRTRTKCVGFLSDVKRLNVTLTRAQALMIIVGDPATLENDRHWKEFIKYCRVHRALAKPSGPAEPPKNQANKQKQSRKENPPKQATEKKKTKQNPVKKVAKGPQNPPKSVPVNSKAEQIEDALSSYLWFKQQLESMERINVERLQRS